jgi:predicted ABC-type transport system involved in lysophospholipase L1 biosynthesis ATPase subunit
MIYGGQPPRVRRERAAELLERVGLGSRMGHRPNQLSGGQQQRVAIARSLANRPDLLLADEPTGALDEKNAESLTTLLLDLQKTTGVSLVMVTHHPAQAARMGRVLTMHEGALNR